MKKIILALILGFISINSFALCFNTRAFSVKLGDGNWEEWEPVDAPVCIEDGKITIYTNLKQIYTIITSKTNTISDTDEEVILYCIDQDEDRCNVKYRHYRDENGKDQLQLYIIYRDIRWVYDITPTE